MLPLLDELNTNNSIIKAVRTIEAFAGATCMKIETEHPETASVINHELANQFSRMIDNIELEDLSEQKHNKDLSAMSRGELESFCHNILSTNQQLEFQLRQYLTS